MFFLFCFVLAFFLDLTFSCLPSRCFSSPCHSSPLLSLCSRGCEADQQPGDGKKGKVIGLDWMERTVNTHTLKMEEVEMHRQHPHVE